MLTVDTVTIDHEEKFYDSHAIELRLGVRATRVDRDARQVEMSDGERLGYGKLLLTTGSSAVPLNQNVKSSTATAGLPPKRSPVVSMNIRTTSGSAIG